MVIRTLSIRISIFNISAFNSIFNTELLCKIYKYTTIITVIFIAGELSGWVHRIDFNFKIWLLQNYFLFDVLVRIFPIKGDHHLLPIKIEFHACYQLSYDSTFSFSSASKLNDFFDLPQIMYILSSFRRSNI